MSKIQFFAALVLLLLVLEMKPSPASARFKVLNVQQHRRGLQGESTPTEQAFMVTELISFDHVKSPFSRSDMTKNERALMAVQRSRRRAQSLVGKTVGHEKVFSSPEIYPDQGSYLIDITIGTPPRNLVAIADTGSDLAWIQCKGCKPCFTEPDILFDPSASSTYTQILCKDPECLPVNSLDKPCPVNGTGACEYDYGYEDSSDSGGILSKETITLTSTNGSTSTFPGFYFGCGFNQSGDFGNTDGLVGLGQGDLSLVAQLGPEFGNVFSYCLVNWDTTTTKTSPLLLGSAGSLPLKYTPLLTNIYNPSFYYVNLLGITVAGKVVTYPPGTFDFDEYGDGGWIVDSGTTLTYMAEAAYTPFVAALRSAISYPKVTFSDYDLCYNLAGVSSPKFPTVVFRLQNVDVTMPYENIFYAVDDQSSVCLAFQSTYSVFDDSVVSIFGNVWQQNFQIAYDRGNQKLGIAPTTC